MNCYNLRNPAGGFVGTHNGRCARGIASEDVHLAATHHVKSGSACMHVCEACAREFERRKDKDTEVERLEA